MEQPGRGSSTGDELRLITRQLSSDPNDGSTGGPFVARYRGENAVLHYIPHALAFVIVMTAVFAPKDFVVTAVFVALGAFAALSVPWRFVIVDQGIGLWFGFGKRRFVDRDALVIYADHNGIAARPRAQRFGYPLVDGIIERRRDVLRAVLLEHGFDVTSRGRRTPNARTK